MTNIEQTKAEWLERLDKLMEGEGMRPDMPYLLVNPIYNLFEGFSDALIEAVKVEVEGMKCDERKTREYGLKNGEGWVAETYNDKMLVNAALNDIITKLSAKENKEI